MDPKVSAFPIKPSLMIAVNPRDLNNEKTAFPAVVNLYLNSTDEYKLAKSDKMNVHATYP